MNNSFRIRPFLVFSTIVRKFEFEGVEIFQFLCGNRGNYGTAKFRDFVKTNEMHYRILLIQTSGELPNHSGRVTDIVLRILINK